VLKQRIITGLVLVALILLAIIYLPFYFFSIFLTLFMLFAAWEWGILIGIHRKFLRLIFVACVGLCLFFAWHSPIIPILVVSILFWLGAFFFIIFYPKGSSIWASGIWIRTLMGIVVIVPCWLALNTLRAAQDGSQTIIFMLFLVWAADTGAYFAGKSWGKNKLCPRVSPNKTWEGVYGGVLLTAIVAAVGAMIMNIAPSRWFILILLSLFVAIFSVIGDLFESMLKRQIGIKDTGTYLPGHGGFLDRIDSLLAAAPLFLLGLLLFGFF